MRNFLSYVTFAHDPLAAHIEYRVYREKKSLQRFELKALATPTPFIRGIEDIFCVPLLPATKLTLKRVFRLFGFKKQMSPIWFSSNVSSLYSLALTAACWLLIVDCWMFYVDCGLWTDVSMQNNYTNVQTKCPNLFVDPKTGSIVVLPRSNVECQMSNAKFQMSNPIARCHHEAQIESCSSASTTSTNTMTKNYSTRGFWS